MQCRAIFCTRVLPALVQKIALHFWAIFRNPPSKAQAISSTKYQAMGTHLLGICFKIIVWYGKGQYLTIFKKDTRFSATFGAL